MDFDTLTQEAYEDGLSEEESIARQDKLYRALFELQDWLFVSDPATTFERIPLVRDVEEKAWVFAFADQEKLDDFLAAQELNKREAVSISPEKALDWLAQIRKRGIFGVQFNFGGYGFYSPIDNLSRIYNHLFDAPSK